MARRNRPNAVTRPAVFDEATGREVGNAALLRDAHARAERWQARVKAGLTARDRARPATTSRPPEVSPTDDEP